MTSAHAPPARPPERGWTRAAALFGVAVLLSVLQPSVLVAVPLLVLIGLRGLRSGTVLLLATIAMMVTVLGARDDIWYVERAWALLVAGWFAALTLALPAWRLAMRALTAVLGSVATVTAVLALRQGAWQALDWTISSRVVGSVATTVEAMRILRQGEPMPATVVGTLYEMAERQAAVYPAMVALASMAALGVASWVFTRASGGGDRGVGPMREFRFNDHLVWLLIGGLVLMVARWGDAFSRLGANAVVFMGALYALRGAAVAMFVSGGLSLMGSIALAVAIVFAAPVVLGVALLIGIGDTWLDLRARVDERAT